MTTTQRLHHDDNTLSSEFLPLTRSTVRSMAKEANTSIAVILGQAGKEEEQEEETEEKEQEEEEEEVMNNEATMTTRASSIASTDVAIVVPRTPAKFSFKDMEVLDFTRLLQNLSSASVTLRRGHMSINSAFKTMYLPSIPIEDYVRRVYHYMCVNTDTHVVAMTLARRLQIMRPQLFCSLSLHKIMVACTSVAVKLTEDYMYDPIHYADCAGVKIAELNFLELNLATLLHWNLFVAPPSYYCKKK